MYPKILQKFDSWLAKGVNKYVNRKWYNLPLTKEIRGSKEDYLEIAEKAKNKKFPVVDDFENKYGFSIEKRWMEELALHTQIVKKRSAINYQHGRLLYTSLCDYIKKNKPDYINIVETGTARGFSALCMAKALEDNQMQGKLITFDVLPHHHKMYWNCIDDLDGEKTRSELLKNYHHLTGKYIVFHQGSSIIELPKVQMERVHFAFLDGSHDYFHLMKEFKQIHLRQIKGDIVFFDDYSLPKYPGVVKAVDEICQKYNYSKNVIKSSSERGYVIAVREK